MTEQELLFNLDLVFDIKSIEQAEKYLESLKSDIKTLETWINEYKEGLTEKQGDASMFKCETCGKPTSTDPKDDVCDNCLDNMFDLLANGDKLIKGDK